MNNFETTLVICAVVLFIAAFAYYRMRADKKNIASIPEEFKYIYLCYRSYINFLAIDPRNKKMLLSLEGARKIYDFSDIQGYEKDSHVSKSTRNSKPISTTWYHLILHVNDPENPTWKFSSDLKDEFDCIEFLVSRALDGTLPDTDERRIFDIMNAKECASRLSSGKGRKRTKGQGRTEDGTLPDSDDRRIFDSGNAEKCESRQFAADIKELTAAAEAGDADAQYELGSEYYIKEDDAKAAEWYLKAAEQGHAEAQYEIGTKYEDGEGVERDAAKAAEWYLKAAEQGHALAQLSIAVAYANGEGVKEDSVTAYMWCSVASMTDPGLKNIKDTLESFGKDMTATQIKEAEREAKAKFEEIKRNKK